MKPLKVLAWVSALYDFLLAAPLLVAPVATAHAFGAPAPIPVLNAQLNGVFALSLALGYAWAAGDPASRRGYFWVAGVFAKSLGALLFVADHFWRGSPATFLVFAVSDGALAILTAVLLVRTRGRLD